MTTTSDDHVAGARATLILHAAAGIGAAGRRERRAAAAAHAMAGDAGTPLIDGILHPPAPATRWDVAVVAALPAALRADAEVVADGWLRAAGRLGARPIVATSPEWPSAFDALPDAPELLWVRGAPAIVRTPCLAIVGTRNATPTGLRIARALAEACAGAGITVVSGLARGIDGAAHDGALAAGGLTIAVQGTGIDVPYPRQHAQLQERIGREGLCLTEVAPGDRGHGGTFPLRNRLIAALASHVVVVEAGAGSGALITADRARTLGRDVLVVPGRVDAPQCVGSNALLRAADVRAVCSAADLLEELGVAAPAPARPALDGDAAAAWDALTAGYADVETIAVHAALDVRRVVAAVATLELHGLVQCDATGALTPLVVT